MPDFSTEDFHAANQLVSNILTGTRTAPKKYLDLQANLQFLSQLLNELEKQAKNPFSILRQRCHDRRREWLGIVDSLGNTLCDIQDSMKRSCMSAWTRWFRYSRKRTSFKTLKRDLKLAVSDIKMFVESLGLSPLGRQEPVLGMVERLLVEEVRGERAGERRSLAVLAAHETNDPVVWEEVRRILVGRGVDEGELGRRCDGGRLRQVVHWVVKNEPDITAVMEMQDGELELERKDLRRGYGLKA
ncbi:hypothetical protein ONS95_002910 [Cadophora gregata]|uniref:uncharacterized protein n=1 Tax=Cadophora gregata TaxID=51156 RepID=UPI0026DDC2D1|nr:uncharacterized protein ONS95_002910 [Cadophora gregata]KAK0108089.1 hypothetical protein ONS95_002910 [Cadophora gregata]KAK0109324.1 hypothetical protein ONS96_003143 [Cadophora gregata f. sp. sojae]